MHLLIYGSKEFSLTVAELAEDCGHQVAGFIDDFAPNVLGTFEQVCKSHPPQDYGMAIAIGYTHLEARWKVWNKVRAAGYETQTEYVWQCASIGRSFLFYDKDGNMIQIWEPLGEPRWN